MFFSEETIYGPYSLEPEVSDRYIPFSKNICFSQLHFITLSYSYNSTYSQYIRIQ